MSTETFRKIIFDQIRFANVAKIPKYVFEGSESAAFFFCAWRHGRADVIQAYNNKTPHVHLIDRDEGKMDEMRLIYPPSWTYEVGDAFEVSKRMIRDGENQFDIVVCDPWAGQTPAILTKSFRYFYLLSRRFYVAFVTVMDWFVPQGLEIKAQAVSAHLSKIHGEKIVVRDVVYRALGDRGGAYWLVIERPNI